MSTQETLISAFPDTPTPYVSYGLPFPEACLRNVAFLGSSRVYIICSGTIARSTSSLDDLKKALGPQVVGVRIGMKPHTYMSEVLSIAEEVRSLKADVIVTLGGSSLSDGAKAIVMAVANDKTTPEALKTLPHAMHRDAPAIPPSIRVICIPTTLSGGEYSNWSGVTEDATGLKYQFCEPLKAPDVIILDGQLACTLPLNTFLASGIRALDHCVEALCSLENGTKDGKRIPVSDDACVEGLKQLVPGLLRCKDDEEDAESRFKCALGVVKSLTALHMGVMKGASHGIGHMLGPFGVPHGSTSCILTPAVAKFNAANFPKSTDGKPVPGMVRQRIVSDLLWSIPEAEKVFNGRGLEKESASLGDLLDAFISELGMPRHLSEVGIGREKFDDIAAHAMQDFYLQSNPVPLYPGMEDKVKEILEMCA